ncbi:hypothetical protein Pcinc_004424 [Petrolisthes cinctipes]|uniref:Uncharacterized protein n=1 Tax=Petrolisthes cinctipes TaxID=88211 RepID=A0AAE1GEI2_PETCI|nr:hypothetical protein Pcinc_004424 [Petrolisthes cinctipes]
MAENDITQTSHVPSARTCILHIERASTSDQPRSEVQLPNVPPGPPRCERPNVKNALEKLKDIDGSMLPSCETELSQHIKRASYVAGMWTTTNDREIMQHPSSEDGWELKELGRALRGYMVRRFSAA